MGAAVLPAAIAAGGGIAQGLLGFGAASAQRAWEERMANTQYQRGVVDMRKAGLNPALMYGSAGPAPTPNVGMAQVPDVASSVSSALQAAQLMGNLRLLKSQADKLDAEKTWTDTRNTIDSVQNLAEQLDPGTVKTSARALFEAQVRKAQADADAARGGAQKAGFWGQLFGVGSSALSQLRGQNLPQLKFSRSGVGPFDY